MPFVRPAAPVRRLGRIPARLVACVLLLAAALPAYAKDTARIRAEEIFRQLPTSIFDNTLEPVGEEDKERLLDRGYISNWVILHKAPDILVMSAMSQVGGEVILRLFRAPSGGVAMLGAKTGDACASELWRYDAHGGIVPDAGPAEPPPADFFAPGRALPPGVSPSYRLCLENDRLEAKPLFWNSDGLVDILPDNRIFFAWNGTAFVQQVEPRTAHAAEPDKQP